jgi:hypothetical protein
MWFALSILPYILRACLWVLFLETVTPAANTPREPVGMWSCCLSPSFVTSAFLSILLRGQITSGQHLATPNPLLILQHKSSATHLVQKYDTFSNNLHLGEHELEGCHAEPPCTPDLS